LSSAFVFSFLLSQLLFLSSAETKTKQKHTRKSKHFQPNLYKMMNISCTSPQADVSMDDLLTFAFQGEIIEDPAEELFQACCLPESILSETFDADIFDEMADVSLQTEPEWKCSTYICSDGIISHIGSTLGSTFGSALESLTHVNGSNRHNRAMSISSAASFSSCCGSQIECLSTCPSFSTRNAKNPLPPDFFTSAYTVIFSGRRGSPDAPGNQHLAEVTQRYLKAYSAAPDKPSKSAIVTRVYSIIQEANPLGGAFCKLVGNTWYNVGERSAREKIGCMFREFLHREYKSSNKSKAERRKKTQQKCNKCIAMVA
jgi:hypothetical protein